MKWIITESTKRQLADFTSELNRVSVKSREHRDGINKILATQFGDEYLHNREAMEYFDKHANDIGMLETQSMLLDVILPRLPDPKINEMLGEALDTTSNWNNAIADKPAHPAETRLSAMNRTLASLENFVMDHRGKFEREEHWHELMEHLTGMHEDLREITLLGETARRLSGTIKPANMGLAKQRLII